MKKILLLFILIPVYAIIPQNNNRTWELLPKGNTFQSLKANYIEPSIGLSYYPSTGFFKVDAGSAFDLIRFYHSTYSEYSFGTEFFIHAKGLNIKNKRLPIDAADGYFGVYFSYADLINNIKARLRVIHNSAHLVDGHLERNSTYLPPIDYTDDFAELTIIKYNYLGKHTFDYYAGVTYSIIIHPKEIKKLSFHYGLQYSYNIYESLLNTQVSLFTAYHFSLGGIEEYRGNNRIIAGVEFGKNSAKQLAIYISYYEGKVLFNQYFNKREKKFSVGFSIR